MKKKFYRWSSADKKGKRMRTDYFEWSKEMSTYLVCLVIGQYDSLQTMADGRTKVRVFTPWGQREQGRFALEVNGLTIFQRIVKFNLNLNHFGGNSVLAKALVCQINYFSIFGGYRNYKVLLYESVSKFQNLTQVTKRSLEFFNAYFGKRYPLPKLDMVALSRLSVGAMENWGLITCRETGLIIETSDATPAQLQKIATLIAHEVSHQV